MDMLRGSVDMVGDPQDMTVRHVLCPGRLLPGDNYHVKGEVTLSWEHINMYLEHIDRS
jgi:hypothetical protein